MKFSFASFFTKLTLATSVASALVGCDDPDYATPSPVTTSTVGQAQVTVVNASPGATGTTVTVDNAAFGTALPYLSATNATAVNAGLRLFEFSEPTNIKTASGTTIVPASRTSFSGGTNYLTFITDAPTRAAAGTDVGGIRTLTLTTSLAAPANADNARIRFVNLSSSGTYGIFNSITQASLFSAAPTRAYRGLTTGTGASLVTFANFTEVPAATYTLDVRSAVTTPLVGTQQVITFAKGKSYTLYVRGIAGNNATPLGISVVQHN
ncbi:MULTISPECIES: DUF4397 domain-containing protein [Hymenobacter]|uniref:DUF4397 domain-containing protein n=1 Tax=Hymenobacter mucosus TaxID=1411120 RepID=A0A238YER3_9BACT|nr:MULTISPECIES: DUF4397 domain-containing protein [Hymenobacter]SNR69637.1 protein of unknown function [Hymenobacter mucosus]